MAHRSFLFASFSVLIGSAALAQASGGAAPAVAPQPTPTSETRLVAPDRPQPTAPAAPGDSPHTTATAAPTWQDAFPAAPVASYLAPKVRILVAAAGEDRATAQTAANALLRALRASDRVQLVMTDAALGSLDALSDEEIVAKAKTLPVDLVSVVRVFPSAGGPGTAVVTHYSLEDGEVAFAWAASPRAPLEAREAGDVASSGVRAQAVEQVAAVAQEGVKAEEISKAEYDQKYIGYEDFVLVQQYQFGAPQEVGQRTKFHRGIYKKELPLPELFTLVERADLRAKYDTNMTLKVVAIVGGIGAMGGSLVPLFTMGDAPVGDLTPLYLSLGLVTGGGLLAILGFYMDPNPVPMHEVRALADGYNRKLKGEEPAVAGDRVSAWRPIDVNLGIAPVEGGAVAGVSGRF